MLVKHVLRNSLIPIVTLFGLDFAAVVGGSAILTETVFDLKGVGQYAADSVQSLDLPPIMGVTIYATFFIVFFSVLVDLLYAWLDPRIGTAPRSIDEEDRAQLRSGRTEATAKPMRA